MGYERPSGSGGDLFRIDSAQESNRRAGHDDANVVLVDGDVLMLLRNSGDCFANYEVFRDKKKIGTWCGYMTGVHIGSVLADVEELP